MYSANNSVTLIFDSLFLTFSSLSLLIPNPQLYLTLSLQQATKWEKSLKAIQPVMSHMFAYPGNESNQSISCQDHTKPCWHL